MFFIDEDNKVFLTYDSLIDRIKFDNYYYKFLITDNFSEIFVNIIKTLILNEDLYLIDSDIVKTTNSFINKNDINKKIKTAFNFQNIDFPSLTNSIINSQSKIILFTSGTTGNPKPIKHSIEGILKGIVISDNHINDIWGFAYNPVHIAGIQVFFQAFLNKNTIVNLFNKQREYITTQILKYKITHISATPTFYKLLMPFDITFDSVERITCGGEQLNNFLINELKKAFPKAKINNIYASTEAGTLLISKGEYFEIPESLKEFIRINNNKLEIHKKKLGESENFKFINDWYCTEDVVEIINDNPLQFKIIGRESEEIKIGGNRVNLTEVENILNSHPSIIACKVYPKKNSLTGYILCADIVTKNKINENEIIEFLSDKLQTYKIPRIFKYVEKIELTRTGKIKR